LVEGCASMAGATPYMIDTATTVEARLRRVIVSLLHPRTARESR
jgi:hypothetical protein